MSCDGVTDMQTVEEMIKSETNPEILRELALFINQQAGVLALELEALKKERAKEEQKKQAWLNQAIEAHLHKLQKRFFDRGRESVGDKTRVRRNDEKKQLLLHAQSLAGEPAKSEARDLPVETTPYFASLEEVLKAAKIKDKTLTEENSKIEEMKDFFETATEITITERTYKKVIHKRQKYRVTNKNTKKETIVTAKGPLKLLPGCKYGVDLALAVVKDKFLNHMPYDRQLRDMTRAGLDITVMTMFRLSEQVALHMEGICEKIRADIFGAGLSCHLDETTWPILSKHADDGQMWVLSNQAGSYYRFEPTRSGAVADELLKGYEGPVLTDKYAGYLPCSTTVLRVDHCRGHHPAVV